MMNGRIGIIALCSVGVLMLGCHKQKDSCETIVALEILELSRSLPEQTSGERDALFLALFALCKAPGKD